MGFSLDYAVTRVDSGGLQILATGAGVQITPSNVEFDGDDWSPPWAPYGQWLQSRIASTFSSMLGYYKDQFLGALAGQHKLILPGAGSFLCNQVMFSAQGDLLTNLAFNGQVNRQSRYTRRCRKIDANRYPFQSNTTGAAKEDPRISHRRCSVSTHTHHRVCHPSTARSVCSLVEEHTTAQN